MILKTDVTYPNKNVHSKEYPLDPAAFFQACVAANSHQLDVARTALLTLESAACLRIEAAETTKTSVTVTGPRLPKLSELSSKGLFHPSSRLMVGQPVYWFENDDTHLRYFFDGEFDAEMLKYYSPFRLGHGESLCVTTACLCDSVPAKDKGLRAWEPSKAGKPMRILRPGLLDDLILHHEHRRSSHEVDHKIARFSTADRAQVLMYRFYANGKETSFADWEVAAVAGMLRHAAITQVPATLRDYVSNHSNGPQVAYLPLPTCGHEYSDGRIRRACVVDPLGCLPLHRIAELKLVGLDGRTSSAVRQTESDYVFDQYTKASRKWTSVTPVLLSGFDTKHGRKDVRKTQKMLKNELRHVGLKPRSVTLFPQFLSTKLDKHGKQLTHTGVTLEFEDEQTGLLTCGAGRNQGLGVFAAA